MSDDTVETRYGACNLCEAICGLEFRVREGEILSIRGDDADPLSRGHICPKAVALQDIQNDPDRLRKPVRREGDEWVEIDWDEAFDRVVDGLLAVREAHGQNAIGAYLGNPSVHNYGVLTHAQAFLKPLQTRSRFSATSVDQLPHHLAALQMYGHQFLIPIPDIDRTSYFLMLGANPMASNGSLMTVPDFRNRLKALQSRGGKLVVIDPRRTETARLADEHHFIRPGTDAALLLALIHSLFEQDLVRPGALAEIVDGMDDVRAAVSAFTPEAVAEVTGIDAADIRRIAADFAAADGAACYGRMGVSTQQFGAVCQWAIQVINVLTGNLDRPGGVMFTKQAVDMVKSPTARPGHYDAWRSRVSDLPEFGGELPVAALAEEITTPGDGQIRAMITVAGNPVLSTPNGRQLEEAFSGLEFMVAVDPYINETTRFADVILPPTSPLEHDHYDLVFHVFAVRNTTRFNEPLFERPEGALHDWEIFQALGDRIRERLGMEPEKMPPPEKLVDMGLRAGPWGQGKDDVPPLTLDVLKAHPHGIDLGPMQPCLPDRLCNDGRIDCAPSALLADIPRVEATLIDADPAGELLLIGRRHLRSNNSWMHNYHRLVKGKPRCTLFMHPADMAERQISDGDEVVVQSRTGEVRLPVQATDEMMPGVVSIPHGWGHGRGSVRLSVATAHAGVSVNDLTDESQLDVLSGNAALNGVPVEVRAGG